MREGRTRIVLICVVSFLLILTYQIGSVPPIIVASLKIVSPTIKGFSLIDVVFHALTI